MKQQSAKAATRAVRREERKERKARAKQKSSEIFTQVCPPDAAGRSLRVRLLGAICRAVVIFCAVNGLASFLSSAFQLAAEGETFLPSLIATSLLYLICYRWYFAVGGVAVVGGMLAVHLSAQGDLMSYLTRLITVGFNSIFRRFYAAGYYSYAKYILEENALEDAERAALMQDFVTLLCWVIAICFVPFLARRVRIVPPLIVTTASLVFVFTYNFPATNWAIVGMIAGFSAVLVMHAYERLYVRRDANAADGENALFADGRPPLPERMRDRAAWREAQKAQRKQRREAKINRMVTGQTTVEEELDSYLGRSKKQTKQLPKKRVVGEDAKKERQLRRLERRQMAAVRAYDRTTADTRLAMGGFAGAAMMLLILVLLFIPASTIRGAFNTIDTIDHRIEYYREYVTAKLRGDDATVDMYAYGEDESNFVPHSTTAETQEFQNITLMRVYSQFDAGLYMQGWVGVDYTDGAWQAVNDEQLYAWRQLYDVQDLPSETMWEGFFSYMNPLDILTDDLTEKYFGYEEYGFVAYMTNVRRLTALGTEVYAPRIMSEAFGITDYRQELGLELPFANFFDGILVGSTFAEQVSAYSSLTYAPTQLDSDWYINMADLIAAYEGSRKEILRYDAMRNKRVFKTDYVGTRTDDGYCLLQQYLDGTLLNHSSLVSYIKEVDTYTDFVYNTYLDGADSEIIAAYAKNIYESSYSDEDREIASVDSTTGKVTYGEVRADAQPMDFSKANQRNSSDQETYEQRHLLTMAVIDRLVNECEYTLTITKQGDPTLCGVENFLTATNEGYCVQFASAAVLLLREMGIPARYVEGYICADYTRRIHATDDLGRYVGRVLDSSKHAWMEVWYDGIGWVTYETTPAYYVSMYGNTSSTGGSLGTVVLPSAPSTTPDPTPSEDEIPELPSEAPVDEDDTQQRIIRIVLISLVIALVAAVLFGGVIWVVRSAKRAEMARVALAKAVLSGDASVYDSEEHRSDAARKLWRQTMTLLELYGTAPRAGELRDEYAKRLSFEYVDVFGFPMEYADENAPPKEFVSSLKIGEVLAAVAAEEFGYGMTKADMMRLADFYLALNGQKKKRLSRVKRWKLRYMKRLI